MLGTGAAGELAGGALILEATLRIALELAGISALRPRRKARPATGAARTAWATLAATIEDGPAALNAGIGPRSSGRSRRRRRRRSFVNGTRPGLRHDDFASLYHGSQWCSDDWLRCRSLGNRLGDGRGNGRRNGGSGRHSAVGRRDRHWRRCCDDRSGHGFSDSHGCRRNNNLGLLDNRSCGSCLNFWLGHDRLGWRRDDNDGSSNDRRRNNRRCSGHHRRLDHHGNGRRRYGDSRTDDRSSRSWAGPRTRNHRPRRGTGCDGGRRSGLLGRSIHDRRSLARLRNDPARLGTSNHRWRRNVTRRRRSRARTAGGGIGALAHARGRRTHHHRWRRRCRTLRILRRALGFLLAGQNGLHRVAGLGDIRQIDVGAIVLLEPRTRRWSRPGPALKIVPDAHGLTLLDRTRVGLALRQIHSFQCVENLFTLDFQLTRQIVNSNLTQSASFRCPALCRLTGHSNLAAS